MGIVMFDRDKLGNEVHQLFAPDDEPEKIYQDYVDHYGDKRDSWRPCNALEKALVSLLREAMDEVKYLENERLSKSSTAEMSGRVSRLILKTEKYLDSGNT